MNWQLLRFNLNENRGATKASTATIFSGLAIGVLLLFGPCLFAQTDDDRHQSVVFYSLRDGNATNQIYVMDPDGSNQERLTFDAASDTDPDISPDGRNIVFTSGKTGSTDILVENLRSGAIWNVTNDPSAANEWPRFSPDGEHIVYDRLVDGAFEIFVADIEGRDAPKQLTFPPTLGRYPSWSPDGKRIVFRYGVDIAVMDADGRKEAPVPLTAETGTSFAQMAVWSPDGRYIAFMSLRKGYCSVFLMHADGSDQVNLTPKPTGAKAWCGKAPAWSADGREILFTGSRDSTSGHFQIFVMGIEGDNCSTAATCDRQLTFDGTSSEARARADRLLEGFEDSEHQ
jgi:TolB protein